MDRRHFLRGLTAGLAAPALAGMAGRGLFEGMAFAEDAAKKPVLELGTTPKTVVCLGDSVTGVYYHTGGERAYPELLEIALKKVHPGAAVNVVNAGISGNTTENGLARLDKDVLAKKPDLVTVTFGLNDMGRLPAEKFHENLKTIVERCRAVKSEVMLCSTNAVINTSGRPIPKLLEFNEITRKTAAEVGVPFCDTYAAYEALEKKDAWDFRLTLSDEIHPNLHGHKIMARAICRAITGKDASLDDLLPPPALTKTLAKLKKDEPVKVLAMPPYEASVSAALAKVAPGAKIEVVAWPIQGKTLPELDADAKSRVRALKPDLVVIAVPRSAAATSDEEFVRSYLWVMNWSLGFGTKEWDAIVVHPNVADSKGSEKHDALIPRLVKGQDLWLVERTKEDAETAPAAILEAFLKRQASS
jgi:lysophospholipase L1-like esterase